MNLDKICGRLTGVFYGSTSKTFFLRVILIFYRYSNRTKTFTQVYHTCFISLPNNKTLKNKLKAFADEKINVAKLMISVFKRAENIVVTSIFSFSLSSPFPTMFIKVFFLKSLKVKIVSESVGRVLRVNSAANLFHDVLR